MKDDILDECVFCKITAGTLPSHTIYEDMYFLAFLDIFPASKGHTLLIPKIHCSNILELPEIYSAHCIPALQTVTKAILQTQGTMDCNILHNIGTVAGQVIFHMHWHIIPRFSDDSLVIHPTKKIELAEEELRACATSIKAQISLERCYE